MKPAPFDYACPTRVDEAVALLAAHAGEAKILAGGQSLVPLLNFRLLRPSLLIDIDRLSELDYIAPFVIPAKLRGGDEIIRGGLRIGALTRHHALETASLVRGRFPVLSAAMPHVAHLAIRNRGTIGGSLSHADPAAELPMMAVLLDAVIHSRSAAGPRSHAAGDFFTGPLSTALADDEIVTEITLPALPSKTGWGFEEFALRAGDFAIAAAAATMRVVRGKIAEARLAVTGVDATPLRLRAVEARLAGQTPTPALIEAAGQMARDRVNPPADLRASADYRRHLVGVLTERVLAAAGARAG